jgi:gamma-glutamylcyclotransferase (GGCT)/AIG2-like uncharacterized protein YtfP
MQIDHTEHLFSYGTLRYEKVQLATFGRKLEGEQDYLPGYYLEPLKITDPEVIATSGEDIHSIVRFSGSSDDQIPGIVFKVSLQELEEADKYEVADYKRIQLLLRSGILAWVYVSAESR